VTTAYARERRLVLRRLASYLDESIVGDYEWLSEQEDSVDAVDGPTHRRRVKAARAVMLDLERRGAEPTPSPPPTP